MTLLRSALLSTLLLAACGGSSKSPSTMPEPAAAPASDEAATPVESPAPAEPALAVEPEPAAAPVAAPEAQPAPAPTKVERKTRAPAKKASKNADPCDGGE